MSLDIANLSLHEKDSIPFDNLPDLLKFRIQEKFTYEDYATFDECSKSCHHICDTNTNARFPTTMHHMQLQLDLVNKVMLTPGNNRIETLFPLNNPPQVRFQVNILYIINILTEELCEFLEERVFGIDQIYFFGITSFPDNYFRIIKKLKPNELFVEVNNLDEDFPTDQTNVDVVVLKRAGFNIRPDRIFELKAGIVLVTTGSNISPREILQQIINWTKSDKNFTNRYVFDEMLEFSYILFLALMDGFTDVPRKNDDDLRWIFQREDNFLDVTLNFEDDNWIVTLEQKEYDSDSEEEDTEEEDTEEEDDDDEDNE